MSFKILTVTESTQSNISEITQSKTCAFTSLTHLKMMILHCLAHESGSMFSTSLLPIHQAHPCPNHHHHHHLRRLQLLSVQHHHYPCLSLPLFLCSFPEKQKTQDSINMTCFGLLNDEWVREREITFCSISSSSFSLWYSSKASASSTNKLALDRNSSRPLRDHTQWISSTMSHTD